MHWEKDTKKKGTSNRWELTHAAENRKHGNLNNRGRNEKWTRKLRWRESGRLQEKNRADKKCQKPDKNGVEGGRKDSSSAASTCEIGRGKGGRARSRNEVPRTKTQQYTLYENKRINYDAQSKTVFKIDSSSKPEYIPKRLLYLIESAFLQIN